MEGEDKIGRNTKGEDDGATSSSKSGADGGGAKRAWNPVVGLRDADLKPAFRALQTAYVKLLQNPFYSPQNVDPIAKASMGPSGDTKITNAGFVNEVKRIGDLWRPGVTSF
ncbi:hypothetical protein KEM56_002317 [Ascosphaera pollenicola]|nr:hypothetical protein KEM56_002317 [Ascosphaera pollenicola]